MLQAIGKISRLKGFFRSGINYSCYDDMIRVAQRKASGSLPKDILSCLITKNADKKSAIQATENTFNEAVNILGEINKLEEQAINRMPPNANFMERMLHFLSKGDIKKIFRLDSLYSKKELETIIRAEDKILSEIKKYIPEVKNVIITSLGSGTFGNGYRLQVLGKDGKRIFGDKVLKVYRDKFLFKILQERNNRYISTLSDKQLLELYEKEREIYKKSGIALPKKTAEELRQAAQRELKRVELSEKELKTMHGAMSEANISEFLKYFSGHNLSTKDGIAIPSFFGLGKTKFSLGEFVGKNTKKERQFDFQRLFLQHQDLEINPENGINGICVDMGGITTLSDIGEGVNVHFDKQILRMLKHLFSCPQDKRKAVLDEYKKSKILSDEVLKQLEKIV